MRQLRVYADTSVYGGCYDVEFEEHSRRFFEEVRAGRFRLVLSSTALRELARAPAEVRHVLTDIPAERIEIIEALAEIEALRDAYVEAGVVGAASLLDAEHVAAATVAGVDLIVSWNFKHIVHFGKIRGYQAVNLMRGYPTIGIYTPRQVVEP